jgi:hypothetical protein
MAVEWEWSLKFVFRVFLNRNPSSACGAARPRNRLSIAGALKQCPKILLVRESVMQHDHLSGSLVGFHESRA